MPERPRDYDDEPTTSEVPTEKKEQQEAMAEFLERLRTETARLQKEIKEHGTMERLKDKRVGKVFEGVSAEKIAERQRESKERKAETVWNRIKREGINKGTLKEFLDNVDTFSVSEMQWLCSSIDDLLREWDPAFHRFLQDLKRQLQAMIRLKEKEDE